MNIFRFLGDMLHTASMLVLLLKLRASKSAVGERKGRECRELWPRFSPIYVGGGVRFPLGPLLLALLLLLDPDAVRCAQLSRPFSCPCSFCALCLVGRNGIVACFSSVHGT